MADDVLAAVLDTVDAWHDLFVEEAALVHTFS